KAVNWAVDGEQGVADPRGISARKLAVDCHTLTADDMAVKTLANCLAEADMELAGLVATPMASGEACLVEDELQHGAACIDIGGGTTSVSLFIRGEVVFADVIRMGGEHITLDIVRGLGLDEAEAERLKVMDGSAVAIDGGLHRGLMDRREARRRGYAAIPTLSDLISIIRPRFEETMEMAWDRLEQAGFGHLAGRRVVLTGGGALLGGSVETAQRIFDRQARIGRPLRLAGLPPTQSGPEFSAVAGLASAVLHPTDDVWKGAKAPKPQGGNRVGRLVQWLRETW
ncbi:MAG: cell division protein FtsA, partial [Pseudomonadota bacterium]